jgi:hypothetical protein
MPTQRPDTQALAHVMWIGGSPCSGKSSISHTITRIFVFLDYHVDAWAANHQARKIAAGDSYSQAFAQMTIDQRWLARSPETMAEETIASWMREFALVVEDLLALPRENLIIAEGNFFPACVVPYLSHPNQAIWLVPSNEFCDQARRRKQAALSERQRRHGVYDEGSDPEERLRRLIARDQQLAISVREQAAEVQLPCLDVDGARSLDAMTARVERHFDPFLVHHFSQQQTA